jgi:hypothetical protein
MPPSRRHKSSSISWRELAATVLIDCDRNDIDLKLHVDDVIALFRDLGKLH